MLNKVPIIAALWALVFNGITAFSADTLPPAAATAAVAYLDYQEVTNGLTFLYLQANRNVVFKKEPALSKSSVFRYTLQLGGKTNNAIPFAWDRTEGKLYLDLNRNLDLTDDPTGVFTCKDKEYPQVFTNVRLHLMTAEGPRPFLLELSLYDFGNRPGVYAAIRSLWQGKVVLNGQEWQVGVLEHLPEQSPATQAKSILLRPWSAHSDPLYLRNGSPDFVGTNRYLFLGGQGYQFESRFEGKGEEAKCRVEFKPQTVKLGNLKITGSFLHRLILTENYTLILDKPEGGAKVPVGNYKVGEVWLRKGTNEALGSPNRWIKVDEKETASLIVGGPLTNSVSVNRRGKNLVLDYQLVGLEQEVYRLISQNRIEEPELAIYQGDTKIHTGKFSYG
jgi:hypothetical protein